MKKKNGFTLIELLAILVILAIIAVITIPKINKVINESKQNAARNSAYGYKDAIEKWEASQQEDDIYLNGRYTITNGKLDNYTIPITGSAPSSGYLTYEDDDLISGCLVINGYEAIYQNGKFTSTGKGDCGGVAPTGTIAYITYNSIYTTQLDPSWDFYIKTNFGVIQGYTEEIITNNEYNSLSECEGEANIWSSFAECVNINGTYKIKSYYGIFNNLQECEQDLNDNHTQEDINAVNVSCVEINDNLKTNIAFIGEFYTENIEQQEVCGVFTNGTVCLEANKWEGSNGGSYIQSKKAEMEATIGGGYTCNFDNSWNILTCEDENKELTCYANEQGVGCHSFDMLGKGECHLPSGECDNGK